MKRLRLRNEYDIYQEGEEPVNKKNAKGLEKLQWSDDLQQSDNGLHDKNLYLNKFLSLNIVWHYNVRVKSKKINEKSLFI